MKSATVFLVALSVFTTLFLESSTAAAVDSTTSEGTIKVGISDIRFLDLAMKFSESIIASCVQETANALVTATGDTKESLTQAKNFFENLLNLCIKLHYEMLSVLANGSANSIEKIKDDISQAIVTERAKWSDTSKTLAELTELKIVLDEDMRVNFANADVIKVKLEEVLSNGKNTSVA
ncbi:uncharacterized protein [Maniola hyperantus]|uniref:uncharacterized protein n=1 Tax=Aphantopus hyperantus TaxID=2795564 RepID=UPI003747EA04